jgi:hypothetical protein
MIFFAIVFLFPTDSRLFVSTELYCGSILTP